MRFRRWQVPCGESAVFFVGRELLLCDGDLGAYVGLCIFRENGKIKRIVVLELHGSVKRNFCVECHVCYPMEFILEQKPIPYCKECGGVVKPDVVLYEEPLDQDVLGKAVEAVGSADTLIIGGTSLIVYPAASLLDYFRGQRLVLINKSVTKADGMADLVIHDSIGHPVCLGHALIDKH